MNSDLFVLLIGVILPPVADLINRRIANSQIRFLVVVILCLLLGTALAFLENGTGVLENGSLIFASSQVVYKMWYENSDVQLRIRS